MSLKLTGRSDFKLSNLKKYYKKYQHPLKKAYIYLNDQNTCYFRTQ